ncbi:MAG: type 1 glutamine amidotransferase [Gammaproteobacteria bacterium]|nr:type 1 glutamine amidotransferase [Gammaproteobacteria bacterium]
MAKVLVFQHVPYEPLGLLDPLIRQSKHRIRYVNFGRHPNAEVEISNYDALILLGGPMNIGEEMVYQHLNREQQYIREAAALNIPILGICLGAQLIAAAFGAQVKACQSQEIGWHDIKLTEQGKQDSIIQSLVHTNKVFQWHGFTFDLPFGAKLLATGAVNPNQAFRIGDNIYGFQFHLEADLNLIQRWLHLPQHQADLLSLGQPKVGETIWRDTLYQWENSRFVARTVFSAFLELLPQVNRVVSFRHR